MHAGSGEQASRAAGGDKPSPVRLGFLLGAAIRKFHGVVKREAERRKGPGDVVGGERIHRRRS
jgi:hypothetical protein